MPDKDEPDPIAELSRAMHGLRDALTDVNLLLEDHLFELDAISRGKAQALADRLLHKTSQATQDTDRP